MKRNIDLKNESGIVLATVLMIILVMSILAISLISINVSQTNLSQSVEDHIKAEELSKGHFWRNYSRLNQGLPVDSGETEILDGKTYTITTTFTQSGAGPNNTDEIQTSVSY